MSTQAQAGGARTARQRRLIAAQVHVSAALILAAGLLWEAGAKLQAAGRWDLRLILLVSAALAVVHALLPWLVDGLTPRTQRVGIWQALVLALLPASATVTEIGFGAVGACQLLLVAAVLAEVGARRRVLTFLWGVGAAIFLLSLWHLREPWL